MSLRSKTFLALVAIFGLYALIDGFVQQHLVLPTFLTLERDHAQSGLQRCQAALNREAADLGDSAYAWSSSTQLRSIFEHDPQSLGNLLGLAQFQQSRANLIAFCNPAGKVVWSRALQLNGGSSLSLPEFATGKVLQNPALLGTENHDGVQGVLSTSAGPLVVAARHVDHDGSMLMGRLVSDDLLVALRVQAGLAFNVQPIDGPLSAGDTAALTQVLDRGGSEFIRDSDPAKLRIYSLVSDVAGKPAFLLSAELPRTISQRGAAAIQYAQASLLFIAVFVLLMMAVLLEKIVLSRVGLLSRFCRMVEALRHTGARVPVSGNDELSRLAVDINAMLAELETKAHQLDLALAESQAATQSKSEFLAVMSHEIRTPMNGVLGMLGVLANTHLSAEQYEHLGVAQESAENLLRLLNDILDFSKIEAGKLEIEEIEFNLPMLIEDSLRLCGMKAREKNIELITDISPDIPAKLNGDPGRVRQIISNLLNNAIKFTHQGYVAVVASVESNTDNSVLLKVSVHDSGIGIPEERLPRLFKNFSQVDASTTRKYGGSGLGLAICNTLAELMGGEVGVESELGRGSTFWFTVRLGVLVEDAPGKPVPLSELKGHSVLVVDDSLINRRVMVLQLSKWGLLVAEADSGRVALDMLRSAAAAGQPYELCILDHIMPGLNGQELGQAILSDETIDSTRLVLLTSAGQRGDATKFHNMGYSAYLSKPVSQNQIVECVAIVLGLEEQSRSQRGALVTKYSLAESQSSSLRVLLAEDNRVNQKVALALLGRAGHKVDTVETGKAAVEAMKSNDYDLVFMDLHMPEMDGFQATQMIRRLGTRASLVPIVAMTARAMEGDRQICLDSGMDDYLAKPINPVELVNIIDRQRMLLELRLASWSPDTGEAERTAQRKGGLSLVEPTFALQPVDWQLGASEKFGTEAEAAGANWSGSVVMPSEPMDVEQSIEHVGERAFWLQLVGIFLEEMPSRLDELRGMIEAGDAQAVENCAHGIKGSCAEMLAEPMRQASGLLELCGREHNLASAPELLDKLIDAYSELQELLHQQQQLVA